MGAIYRDLIVDIGLATEAAADHVECVAIEVARVRLQIGGEALPTAGGTMQHDERRGGARTGVDVTRGHAINFDPALRERCTHQMSPEATEWRCVHLEDT